MVLLSIGEKNQFAECERKTNYPLALTGTWLIFIHVDCGGRILLGESLISIFCYSMRQCIRLWSDIEDDEPDSDSDRIRTLSAAAPTLREQMTSRGLITAARSRFHSHHLISTLLPVVTILMMVLIYMSSSDEVGGAEGARDHLN